MADDTEKPLLLVFAEHLQRHGVEFMVIGGQAAALHGSPLPTYDIDLCYRRTGENLRRLAIALAEIHPSLRGAPPDLPFRLDAETIQAGSVNLLTIGLEDLIEIKRHIGRPKDKAALLQLEALMRLREEP